MIFSVAIFTSSSPKAKTWKEAPPKCIPSSPTEICSNPDGQSYLQRKKYIFEDNFILSRWFYSLKEQNSEKNRVKDLTKGHILPLNTEIQDF